MLPLLIQEGALLLSWRPKWECWLKEGIPKGAACLEWGQVTCLQL